MILSCCAWSFPGAEAEVRKHVRDSGFDWIDLHPYAFADKSAAAGLRDAGLSVSCIAISAALTDDSTLGDQSQSVAVEAADCARRALQYAADLGAATAYVVPEIDDSPGALKRFGLSVSGLADYASELGIRLCIEHAPGRALPTVVGTLEFIRTLGHPNLYLLMDIGHLQMCDEDPTEAIDAAAELLGYVHLDDNDGEGDLHLSLLHGVLTEKSLRQTFSALDDIGYTRAVSLELSPALPNPLLAIQQSREIVLEVAPSLDGSL